MELAEKLHVKVQGLDLKAQVEGDRIVFTGGRQGAHGLAINVSSKERILAHWEGYVENNTRTHIVGQSVSFPSRSSSFGARAGKVVKLGRSRAIVEFKFKNGRTSTASVPFVNLRF